MNAPFIRVLVGFPLFAIIRTFVSFKLNVLTFGDRKCNCYAGKKLVLGFKLKISNQINVLYLTSNIDVQFKKVIVCCKNITSGMEILK